MASWRVVRDFEVLDDGTGAGSDAAWAAAGRKPARKDLDRRAAALVTTFLGWAEAVLERRGADIWYLSLPHELKGGSPSSGTYVGDQAQSVAWLLSEERGDGAKPGCEMVRM